MNRRTVAMILGGGVALALVGRMLTKTSTSPPNAPSAPSGSIASPVAAGRATVTVFDDGNPLPDRVVVFSDEAGTTLGTAKTAKDGTASGPMSAHGMITVAHGVSVQHLVTVTEVEPNDRVVIGEREDEGGVGTVMCRIAIALPSSHPKAARYLVSVGVNDVEVVDASKPTTVAVVKRFIVDGKVRALARAVDASGQLVGFSESFLPSCTPSDAGTAPTIEARLPAWSADLRTFTVEAIGEESAAIEASISLVPPGSDGFALGKQDVPAAARSKLVFLAPRPLGTRGELKIEVKYDDKDHAELEERHATLGETTRIMLGDKLLPRIRDAVVDGATTPRPSVRWTAARALASADVVVARIAWPASREHLWTILAPPSTPARLVFPALPDELASWRPDGSAITAAVGAVETSFWNGYPDVKRNGLDSIEQPPAGDVVIRSTATGDLDF